MSEVKTRVIWFMMQDVMHDEFAKYCQKKERTMSAQLRIMVRDAILESRK